MLLGSLVFAQSNLKKLSDFFGLINYSKQKNSTKDCPVPLTNSYVIEVSEFLLLSLFRFHALCFFDPDVFSLAFFSSVSTKRGGEPNFLIFFQAKLCFVRFASRDADQRVLEAITSNVLFL